MAKRSKSNLSKRVEGGWTESESESYWQEQIRLYGRETFYIDTSAILECLSPDDEQFKLFLNTVVGGQFVTSSYVIAETVRRLVKPQYDRFVGPAGERRFELAIYVLRCWLDERGVAVICIPPQAFSAARAAFEQKRAIGCDLTDVVSYLIVRGLEQTRIVSKDGHFRQLGLTCLP